MLVNQKMKIMGLAAMKKFTFTCLVLFTLTACAKSPEQARKELGQMNISYDEASCYKAAYKGDNLAVDLFLTAGMEPGCALVGASEAGNIELVKKLLDKGAKPTSGLGIGALSLAAKEGRTDIVKLLLDKGASPNDGNNGGSQSLINATSGGHNEIAKILLEKGANPNSVWIEKTLFFGQGFKSNVLALATEKGNAEIVKTLLDKGVNPNDGEQGDSNALIAAIKQNNTEIVKALLEKGANPNSINRKVSEWETSTETALSLAARKGNLDVVNLLLEKGANPYDGQNGQSASLGIAIREGNTEIVKALLDKGTNPNSSGIYMSYLERSGKPEIVELLKKAGAK